MNRDRIGNRSVSVLLSMYGIIYRLPNDEEVEGEAPVLDIPDVPLHTSFHLPQLRCLASEARYLGISRNARLCEVSHHVAGDKFAVLLCVLEHVWTRADDAHVAKPYVDELWQLVDAGTAHEFSDTRLARVILRSLHLVAINVDAHGTELVAIEVLTIQSRALLLEEDGTRGTQLDKRAEDDIDDRKDGDKEDAGGNEIEGTLDDAVAEKRERLVVQGEDRRAVHQRESHRVPLIVEGIGNMMVAHDVLGASLHNPVYEVVLRRRKHTKDLMQLMLVDVCKCVLRLAKVVLFRHLKAWLICKIAFYTVASRWVGLHLLVQFAGNVYVADKDDAHCVAPSLAIPLDDLPQHPAVEAQEQNDESVEGQHEVPRHQGPAEHPHHHEAENDKERCALQETSQHLVAAHEAVVDVMPALQVT